jgi:hypothetical protein
MIFHNWFIPVSLIITLGTISNRVDELMYIAYFSLFGLLYLVGNLDFFNRQRPRNNGYLILGSIGTIVLLLVLSFDWFWEGLRKKELFLGEIIASPEFLSSVIISILAGVIFFMQHKDKVLKDIYPIAPVFILFIITFIIGINSQISVALINLVVFAIGILTIRDGATRNHLGILNYGLLIITAFVVCRFFDTDISFVIRGILFVSVGVGFFATNYWMLKKRNANA